MSGAGIRVRFEFLALAAIRRNEFLFRATCCDSIKNCFTQAHVI